MSEPPDLSRISPPELIPPDQPDQKTAAETEQLRKKGKTPTEREAEAHRAHIEAIEEHAAYLEGEKDQLKRDLADLLTELTRERLNRESLAIKCAQHEAVGASLGCMNCLGNLMTLAGSIVLGVAGSAPNLSDGLKWGLVSGGAVAAACGAVIVLANFGLGVWTWPPKRVPADTLPSPTSPSDPTTAAIGKP